jgi:MerR family redox-sensitive transcriptional activator SoxR
VPATYSIGEVARRVGLSTSALRYYESLGLLPTPERSSGRRLYDQDALDRLAMIDVAQRAGFTLREVRVLLDGLQADTPPTQEWRDLAQHKLAEIDQLLARTEAMRTLLHTWLHCDCLTLDDIDAFRRANTDWAHAQQNAGVSSG